jgi:hypothetical protein
MPETAAGRAIGTKNRPSGTIFRTSVLIYRKTT